MHSPILAPVVALVAWSLVMMAWMYAVRFPAMARKGISLKGRVGSKTGSLEGVVEDHVNWKAHNYNHLMEQPTLFYAIALERDAQNLNRHPGLDPGSTFLRPAEKKVDAGSSPA